MNIRKTELLGIIDQLRDVRKTATMETMSLSTYRTPLTPDLDIDRFTLNQIVRSSTELWRNTWIITPLDEVIETLEKLYYK